MLATLALGAAALAVTPTVQLRSRALEAAQAHEDLVKSAAPVVRQREQLLASVEALGGLAELTNGRIEPLRVLDKLTQVLPDDTALQSIKLQGNKLIFTGQTGNASALLQLLGEVQGFKDVRAPTATTRLGNVGKEAFAVELMLDPAVFGVQSIQLANPLKQAASEASAPAVTSAPSAVPASGPVTTASAPTLPQASGVVSVPALAPSTKPSAPTPSQSPAVQSSPAVPTASPGGLRPSFGGRSTAPAAPAQPASAPARNGASS